MLPDDLAPTCARCGGAIEAKLALLLAEPALTTWVVCPTCLEQQWVHFGEPYVEFLVLADSIRRLGGDLENIHF